MQISWFWFSFPLISAFIKDLICSYYCVVPMVILFSISFIHLLLVFIHWEISRYPPLLLFIYFLPHLLFGETKKKIYVSHVSIRWSRKCLLLTMSNSPVFSVSHIPNAMLCLCPHQVQVWLAISGTVLKGKSFKRQIGQKGSSVSVSKALEKVVLYRLMGMS